MTSPDPIATAPPPIQVDQALVVVELCSTDLGRALWERAQWRVAADVLQRRVADLETQRPAASVPPGGSDG